MAKGAIFTRHYNIRFLHSFRCNFLQKLIHVQKLLCIIALAGPFGGFRVLQHWLQIKGEDKTGISRNSDETRQKNRQKVCFFWSKTNINKIIKKNHPKNCIQKQKIKSHWEDSNRLVFYVSKIHLFIIFSEFWWSNSLLEARFKLVWFLCTLRLIMNHRTVYVSEIWSRFLKEIQVGIKFICDIPS